ncbi:GNAT family N-acetyltransferase [Kineosporia sp. R_H_3]|uniref:GNAT family N-acetyltransferase n=1 Tax=Kineosporia sp. R_H_3 TaxID=1961848 RepID=UPI000B4B17BA|nr:GNAT family N-acetyltransferase [Kineosporia sp. R_H_3]
MTRWTPDAVRAAAAEWVWVPPGAPEVDTDEYHLVGYPESFEHPTQVARCRSARPADGLVGEVAGIARGWGRTTLGWWVGDGTTPAGLGEALARRGAEVVETVDVLAFDLAGGLPDAVRRPAPAGVDVRLVDDAAALRAANDVSVQVWDALVPEDDDAWLAAELADLGRPIRERGGFSVLATVDGVPAATGGCTLADDVARLWGAATVPALRGRGVYTAVLLHRMAVALEHGATLALVKGRVGTSAPILRGVGFTAYGQEHLYRQPLGPLGPGAPATV